LNKFYSLQPKISNTMIAISPEFENLLELFKSDSPKNVDLALELSQHYNIEFEQYFGFSMKQHNDFYQFLSRIFEPDKLNIFLPKIITLDFYGQNLQVLPSSIKILQGLKTLELQGNLIQEIPPEIGTLKDLEFLYLGDNQLTKLPTEIGKLENLKTLYLDGNPLQSLPDELQQLKNLERLYFDEVQLKRLKKDIRKLKTLKKLEIYDNYLPF
jgi:Leucine-rich repeat (LRR) protein